MANGITSWFNNRFGSNITHIANAYSKADHVWVLFSYKELSINTISAALRDVNANIDVRSDNVTEGVRLPFADIHKKRRDTDYEYVTVLSKEQNGSVTTICENLKVLANRSFIITNNGSIQEQKYGGDLWVDWKGTNHKP